MRDGARWPLIFLVAACAGLSGAGEVTPYTSAFTLDCVLFAIAKDVNLGHMMKENETAPPEAGSMWQVCIKEDQNYLFLAQTNATVRLLDHFAWGDNITLTLRASPAWGFDDYGHGYVFDVLHGVRQFVSASTVTGNGAGTGPSSTTPQFIASGILSGDRYFTGQRRIRLLSVIVESNGHVATYAGMTRSAREVWATEQRQLMDEVYRFSTYGKLGFNATASHVRTAALGSRQWGHANCADRGFEVAQAAWMSLGLSAAEASEFDAVLYYEPEAETPACGANGYGTLGVCYVGMLSSVNRNSAYPPYNVRFRSYTAWQAGCFVRYQRSGVNARANVGAHEFGHFLGLGHAGGSGRARRADGSLSTYGDASAIMGNDNSAQNSFTAPARYYLGALPVAAVQGDISRAVTLRALSLGVGSSGLPADTYLAIAVACPSCVSRAIDATGGELWVTFRGDGETCAPEHTGGTSSTYRCHSDHTEKLNQVVVHYRQPGSGPAVEKWYWLGNGEAHTLSTGGLAMRVCLVGADDTAVVAIADSVAAADSKCPSQSTIRPPNPPPTAPAPQPPPAPPPMPPTVPDFTATICSNECIIDFDSSYTYNGVHVAVSDGHCDDGGDPNAPNHICAYGTDCTDCGPRTITVWPPPPYPSPPPPFVTPPSPGQMCTNACWWSDNGLCQDGASGSLGNSCEYGSDCTDCGPRGGPPSVNVSPPPPPPCPPPPSPSPPPPSPPPPSSSPPPPSPPPPSSSPPPPSPPPPSPSPPPPSPPPPLPSPPPPSPSPPPPTPSPPPPSPLPPSSPLPLLPPWEPPPWQPGHIFPPAVPPSPPRQPPSPSPPSPPSSPPPWTPMSIYRRVVELEFDATGDVASFNETAVCASLLRRFPAAEHLEVVVTPASLHIRASLFMTSAAAADAVATALQSWSAEDLSNEIDVRVISTLSVSTLAVAAPSPPPPTSPDTASTLLPHPSPSTLVAAPPTSTSPSSPPLPLLPLPSTVSTLSSCMSSEDHGGGCSRLRSIAFGVGGALLLFAIALCTIAGCASYYLCHRRRTGRASVEPSVSRHTTPNKVKRMPTLRSFGKSYSNMVDDGPATQQQPWADHRASPHLKKHVSYTEHQVNGYL